MLSSPFMKRALELALIARDNGEVPVGAVIVENGEIIAEGYNQNIVLCDPTAHAEIIAIREACKIKSQDRIPECDLYVTLEPCPMCTQAISFARIRRLYYAASDKKGGGISIFSSKSCFHKPEIYSGIMEGEGAEMLRDFFKKLR